MSIRFHCRCGREFRVPDSAAGKRAKCLDCGAQLTVPRPKQASAERTVPPARGPRRQKDNVPVARIVPEESLAVARAVPERPVHKRVRLKRRSTSVPGVQAAMGVALIVMLLVAIDAIIVLARGVRRPDVKTMAMLHAGWLVVLIVGFFIGAAAAKGSRLCIGILIGGALQSLFVNGPGLLIGAGVMDSLAPDMRMLLRVAGGGAIVVGAIHAAVLLAGKSVRKRLAGHASTAVPGAIMGFFFGWGIAVTALPNMAIIATRILATPGAEVAVARALDAPGLLGDAGKKHVLAVTKGNMNAIMGAFQNYLNKHHNYFPTDLGQLVSEDCPVEMFLCPGSSRKPPKVERKTGKFDGPVDMVYLFPAYHLYDLPQDQDELQLLIVCHSDPNSHFGEGAVVMHPPVASNDYTIVRWLDREDLALRLDDTRKWLSRHKPRAPMTPAKSD